MNRIISNQLSALDFLMLIIYALVCIVIGFFASRKQSADDYMIMGRKMGIVGFVSSVVASYIGGAAIVAYTAFVYRFGISSLTLFIGTAIGFAIFIPYAIKLRVIGAEKQFHTLSDWFYFNFNKKVGLLSAIILFIVYFGMLLNQFIAGSTILANISGWTYETSLLVASSIICIYLLAGGFSSVIKTDIFQYIVMFVLIILLGLILFMGDGQKVTNELMDFSRMKVGLTIAFMIFGIFNIFQLSEYWQRVYAVKNEKVVRNGLLWAAFFVVITGFALALIGLAAHIHAPGIQPQHAFAEGLTVLLPHKFISAGLVLIFAAIMSSADTVIFVLSSSLAKDYFAQFSKTPPTQKKLKKQTRLFILIISITGVLFAFVFRDLVAVVVFIVGVGFSIIPAAIGSFHVKLSNRSVIASFLSGLIYIALLIIYAFSVSHPIVFFNEKAEAAIASIMVSTIVLVLFHQFDRFNRKNIKIL